MKICSWMWHRRRLFVMGFVLNAWASFAHAALPDDLPSCRCLENLAMAVEDEISEDVRREAVRIVDDYCEEDRALSELSGHAHWLAQESCMLLHRAFVLETDVLEEDALGGGFEVRFAVQTQYQTRRLQYQNIFDWRHGVAMYAQILFTFRPARSRMTLGGVL